MKKWLHKVLTLLGRGLVRWLELLGENPPLSRHCWPGWRIADELAEQARRRKALPSPDAPAPAPVDEGPPGDRLARRARPHRPVTRRWQRRALLLGS